MITIVFVISGLFFICEEKCYKRVVSISQVAKIVMQKLFFSTGKNYSQQRIKLGMNYIYKEYF